MKVAIQGCAHGDLDEIYASVKHLEEVEGIKVDLVISCGDFQAIRNESDLDAIAVPDKYKELGTFHEYYAGSRKAPYPTLFIGGNHEASNYLWELYYGGWVAPNMFYLGCSGVVNFGGLRIAGLSGIFDRRNYNFGHFEFPPYNRSTLRSVYHVREYEVRKLLQVKGKLDVFLSHDWPRGVANSGQCDRDNLLRRKPYFKEEIFRDELGSPAAAQLCNRLKPSYWFSAHFHVKFPAIINHDSTHVSEYTLARDSSLQQQKQQQQQRQKESDSGQKECPCCTKFLALDKCLPHRDFLQVLDFPDSDSPKAFQYDVEWLAILRKMQAEMPLDNKRVSFQTEIASCQGVSPDELAWVSEKLQGTDNLIPNNFQCTAPPQREFETAQSERKTFHHANPQTLALLNILELPYVLDFGAIEQEEVITYVAERDVDNPEEINIDDNDVNPEEIDIDDDDVNPEEIEI